MVFVSDEGLENLHKRWIDKLFMFLNEGKKSGRHAFLENDIGEVDRAYSGL